MIGVTFEVAGVETVSSKECYEIHVTFPAEETGFQRCYRVYYCTDSGRLVRVRDVSVRPGGTNKDVVTDYPPDSESPTLVEDLPCLVPLDWPNCGCANVSSSPSDTAGVSQTTVRTTVRSTSGSSQQEDQVTLRRAAGANPSEVRQRWRPDEPWWREAKKYEGGRLVREAVLLEVNGNKVADAPEEGQ
jgi:hypothetical protein